MTFLDGGLGTMLQAAGLPAGKDPTDWNLENPEAVIKVHRAYVEAGSEIVMANTFGANRLKYHGGHDLGELVRAAIVNARASGAKRVALDIGPTGRLLRPAGDLAVEDAYAAFSETIRGAVQSAADLHPDLVFIETMGDTRELKAAVLAAKENSDLPVLATVAVGEDGKLLTGASIESVALLLEGLGVDAYGFNCGIGPDRMLPLVQRLARVSTKPIIVKPNAGIPHLMNGKTVFDVGPVDFARHMQELVKAGASIVGGCCGTTPAHIGALAPICEVTGNEEPGTGNVGTFVSSGTSIIGLVPHDGLIIGERINPTGKKKLQAAYLSGDEAFVLREAVGQLDAGAAILDINCGVPGLDEAETLERTVRSVESVVNCPLEIDTADPLALERALRIVDGRPLVNSVNGKRESMDAVFPLVRKYGGVMVALCLDEGGIPATADGRLAVARKILTEGAKYGFTPRDFVFDALTLSVSSDDTAALVTLETVKRLTDELGVNTVLGVSNVSFGLPDRPALNNAMYALAKRNGLSAAIANPSVIRDEILPLAEEVLLGRDPGCKKWIAAHQSEAAPLPGPKTSQSAQDPLVEIVGAIRHGLKEDAVRMAEASLQTVSPLAVIEKGVVPALEEVGRGFENGKLFLPQLLMAADAANDAFVVIRAAMERSVSGTSSAASRPIVLATVKGDIHDIGKNIVRVLLESYGFRVVDLGRDVAPERIISAARDNNAAFIGLSALMTTTVGAMAETVSLLKASGLDCRSIVGGAVVTREYADSIGADHYAANAMETVRIAQGRLT